MGIWTFHDYVPPESLSNLKYYKYHGSDLSLLANYVGQPFWRWSVNLLPRWIAPNLVTLLGLFCMLIGYGCIVYHYPSMQIVNGEEPARWPFAVASICIFLYQTLDALDGKQARRTNSSSPLGELFDHGCDAVSTALVCVMVGTALQYTPTQHAINVIQSMTCFYLAQWEEYHTGEMYLGYVNVTEALVASEIVLMVAAWYGAALFVETGARDVIFWGVLLAAASSALTYAYRTLTAMKQGQTVDTLLLLFPVMVLSGVGVGWWQYSQSDVVAANPAAWANVIGLIGANLVGRIVLARIVREVVSPWQPLLLALTVVAANDMVPVPWVDPVLALYTLVAISLAAYVHFAMYVIETLCRHLNIHCLHIPNTIEDADGNVIVIESVPRNNANHRYSLRKRTPKKKAN